MNDNIDPSYNQPHLTWERLGLKAPKEDKNKVWVLQKYNVDAFVIAFYLFDEKPSEEVLMEFTLDARVSNKLVEEPTARSSDGLIGWVLNERLIHKGV